MLRGGAMGEQTFEGGLVGGGAVSAGADGGVVMDFMGEALDSWDGAEGHDTVSAAHGV